MVGPLASYPFQLCGRCLLGYPAVYLVTAEGVDAAADALSAGDRVLVQLHVRALVRGPLPDLSSGGSST